MPAPKRGRDAAQDEIDVVLQELEGAVGRDADIVISRLEKLQDLIDPDDDSYEVQKKVAGEDGVLNALMQMLEDDSEAVRVEAANTVAALTRHSKSTLQRMAHVSGVSNVDVVEKVSLNPIQEPISEIDGLISVLVNLKFSEDPAVAQAGEAALSALSQYNRGARITILREAVHRLQQGEPKAMEALDSLLAGLEVRDDVAVLLDQALQPVLGFLRGGSPTEQVDACELLGSLCEARGAGAASFLVGEGALAPVVQLLVKGDLQTKDAAAHTAWLLVKDDRRLLSPSKDALGVQGTKLIDPLIKLVKAGAAAEAAADEEDEEDEGEEGAALSEERPPAVANSDDAALLLKALGAQDDDVAAKLSAAGEPLMETQGSCAIM